MKSHFLFVVTFDIEMKKNYIRLGLVSKVSPQDKNAFQHCSLIKFLQTLHWDYEVKTKY